MILLAFGSVFSGCLFTYGGSLQHWLEPVVGTHEESSPVIPAWAVSALALAVVFVGVAVAYRKYGGKVEIAGWPRLMFRY